MENKIVCTRCGFELDPGCEYGMNDNMEILCMDCMEEMPYSSIVEFFGGFWLTVDDI